MSKALQDKVNSIADDKETIEYLVGCAVGAAMGLFVTLSKNQRINTKGVVDTFNEAGMVALAEIIAGSDEITTSKLLGSLYTEGYADSKALIKELLQASVVPELESKLAKAEMALFKAQGSLRIIYNAAGGVLDHE